MDNNDQPLTKKQRRELRKQEKLNHKSKEKMSKIRTQLLVWVGAVVILGAGIYGLIQMNGEKAGTQALVDTIDNVTDNVKGNPAAEVILIEYSDFQCPACATYKSIVNDLMDEFSENVYFSFRHYPLRKIHENAQLAAQAAQAASLQGKFWEMHDKLFENQNEWNSLSDPSEKFTIYAEDLSLDVEKFNIDLRSSIVKDKVDKDYTSAVTAGLNSTPSFILNGEKINTPRLLDDFKKLINTALENDQTAGTNTTTE